MQVETEPTPTGVERLTFRVRNLKQSVSTPDELGFSESMKTKLREMTSSRSGVVLACGAPSSGTTSTRFGITRTVDAYMYGVYTIGDLESRELPYTTEFEVREEDDLETTIQRVIRIDADVILTDAIATQKLPRSFSRSRRRLRSFRNSQRATLHRDWRNCLSC